MTKSNRLVNTMTEQDEYSSLKSKCVQANWDASDLNIVVAICGWVAAFLLKLAYFIDLVKGTGHVADVITGSVKKTFMRMESLWSEACESAQFPPRMLEDITSAPSEEIQAARIAKGASKDAARLPENTYVNIIGTIQGQVLQRINAIWKDHPPATRVTINAEIVAYFRQLSRMFRKVDLSEQNIVRKVISPQVEGLLTRLSSSIASHVASLTDQISLSVAGEKLRTAMTENAVKVTKEASATIMAGFSKALEELVELLQDE